MISSATMSWEIDRPSLAQLAARFPTPFFLIQEARLRSNYRDLSRGLAESGAEVVLRYCAKTNHEPTVLETLADCGSHLLASHGGEVGRARACGFPAERIAFARPVLIPEELEAVLKAGVPLVHLHHPDDLPEVEAAAARTGRRVAVSLRLSQTGLALSPLDRFNRRLGFSQDEAVAACRRLAGSRWLEPAAVNFYLGTQQSGLAGFSRRFRQVLALLQRISAETGITIREINLGGGIPSPWLRKLHPVRWLERWQDRPKAESTGRLAELAAQLGRRYAELVREAGLTVPPRLAAEPGRSIVGDAAVVVTRVRSVRGSWAFLDASRNFLPENPLLFSRRILALNPPGPGTGERFYHLSGSTLNTLDVLDLRRRLPALSPGDTLAFCDAGAYSISRASPYAGLPPAVYWLGEDGEVCEVRAAGRFD